MSTETIYRSWDLILSTTDFFSYCVFWARMLKRLFTANVPTFGEEEFCYESHISQIMRNVWELRVMSSNPEWINFFLLCAVVILFSFVCAASTNALFSSLGSFLNEMVPPVLWMIYIETLLALRLFRERSVCFVLVKRESVRNPVKDTDEYIVCPVHVTFYWFFFDCDWLSGR